MDTVIAWLNTYWWVVLIAVGVAAKVANLVSDHWGEHKGLKRAMLFVVDLLDIIKSTPPPTAHK